MKTMAVLTAIVAVLVGQAETTPAQAAATGVVYLVTRAASAESRALLSARLVKWNAVNLRWYDDAAVVRIELPKESLAAVRADPDVILAVVESESPATAVAPSEVAAAKGVPAAQDPAPGVPTVPAGISVPGMAVAGAPGPPLAQPMIPGAPPMMQPPTPGVPPMMQPPISGVPPMPGGAGVGMGMGASMGMAATGLVDSLAGGMVTRLFNRPPSCKISVARAAAMFTPVGGDQVIEVKASGSCAWQAQASVPWIKINSGMGVSGLGIVSYSVNAAEGKSRAGSISIIGTPGGSPIKGRAIVIVMQAPKAAD